MKIQKFKEGDKIPEGSRFIRAETIKEESHKTYHYDYGIFYTDRTTYTHYNLITYFYYEVEE